MTDGTWNLSTSWPIALFPVRLETRFLGGELCIRVIPDTIHADTHEPELTAEELAAGRRHWQQMAGADVPTSEAVWRALANQCGTQRAGWVARVVRQSTNSQAPFAPAARATSWTRVPRARLLPTRWQATGWLGAESTRVTGSTIADVVPVGPDPSSGGLAMPQWMRDFQTAESVGMGLRLSLTTDMQQSGLDLLLVYGVDESGDPAGGAQQVSELLDAHYYTDGFDYVPAGTPTNNTETVSSGLDTSSNEYVYSHHVSSSDHDQPPNDPHSGAVLLAGALGIGLSENTDPPAPSAEWEPHITAAASALADAGGGDPTQNWLKAQAAVLGGVATAAGLARSGGYTEAATAEAMNSALWAAGLGYFLSQMLAGTDGKDFQRLDHSNIIEVDAYYRYLDRQRLWLEAQLEVITQETGITGIDPGSEALGAAWTAAIKHRAETTAISEAQAEQQLTSEVTENATTKWQHIHPGETFDSAGDSAGATRNLLDDRARDYAYYRYKARLALGGPESDERLEDWLAGETAALYGDATFRAARAHFVSYVRPGGALPAIVIGNQPYGVLAACAVDDWQPTQGEDRLRAFIEALRVLRDTVWKPCSEDVPQLGPDPISDVHTAQETLFELLAMSPLSQQIFAREHVGPDYARNLWRFAQLNLSPDWGTTTAASSAKLLHDIGIAWTPRVSRLIGAEASAPLTAPLVRPSHPIDRFIFWQPPFKVATLLANPTSPGQAANTPLLYRLLRHSALREFATAAIRYQLAAGTLADWEHLDQELIHISPGHDIATVLQQLERTIDGSGQTIASYLESPASFNDPVAADLIAFYSAVDTLEMVVDTDELERNLRQSIDATSHRLDAWITSLADRRLAVLRQKTPDGTLVGGYGWVENLRPRSNALSSDGFIHAPSLPQAITAAVLRSGYQSHTGGATNPFAVDLSSQRTRLASRLLDAVRSGQPVGRLTGYDFERRLQESGAGQYTRPFRDCAPSSSTTFPADGAAATSTQTLTSTQPPSLTDGLVLRDKWSAEDAQVMGVLADISNDDNQRKSKGQPALRPVVDAALAGLNDALDAGADALIAESLHHAINGVPSRAAATLDALARGDGSVPELDLLASPRTGLTIGHRVVFTVPAGRTASTIATVTAVDTAGFTLPAETQLTLTLNGAPVGFQTETDLTISAGSTSGTVTIVAVQNGTAFNGASSPVQLVQQLSWVSSVAISAAASGGIDEPRSGWSAPTANQLRAAANPPLEVLAQSWLPDPGKVRCHVTLSNTDGQTNSAVVRLGSCDLSALDCVYETPAVPADGGADAVPARIRLAVLEVAGTQLSVSATTAMDVTWERTSDFAADELTFIDLSAVCRLARQLLQGSRALRPADLAPIGTMDVAVADPALSGRADAAEEAVRSAAGWVGSATPYLAIRAAANLGILGAAYAASLAEPDAQLIKAIGAELQKRVKQLDALSASTASDRDVQRIQAAFGQDFLPLPAFEPENAADLGNARTLAQQAGWADQPTIRTWMARSARVRPRLMSLVRLRTAARALAASADGRLATLQLPGVEGEAWVGAAFHEARPAGPRVQITVASGPIADPSAPLAGVLVDAWTETVPDAVQTTGLAYHYQSPLSEPPQAVLIAVPADLSSATWTPEALEQTLTETLTLAKVRAVDQDALAQTGQLLPAFYIANNALGPDAAFISPTQGTVSTDVMNQPPPPSA